MNIVERAIQIVSENPSIGRIELAKKLGVSEAIARELLAIAQWELGIYNKADILDYNLTTTKKTHYIPAPAKIFIFSDIHFPFQNNQALDIAIDECIKFKPTHIVVNGDLVDFYQLSSFTQDPAIQDTIEGIQMARQFLKDLTLITPSIYYRIGNHEERLYRTLFTKTKEFSSIFQYYGINIEDMFELKENNITLVSKNDYLTSEYFLIFHGHEIDIKTTQTKYIAQRLLEYYKTNLIIGHFHFVDTRNSFKLETRNGEVKRIPIQVWSIGCLCETEPSYNPHNMKYINGFCKIEVDKDNYFDVQSKKIIDGRVLSA